MAVAAAMTERVGKGERCALADAKGGRGRGGARRDARAEARSMWNVRVCVRVFACVACSVCSTGLVCLDRKTDNGMQYFIPLMGSPRLFIIIPALNEEANIKRAILRYEVPAV